MGYYEDIEAGINVGIGRALQGGIDIELESTLKTAAVDKLMGVLDKWPYELNGRFVRTFAELVVIAEASRQAYNEPKLESSLIGDFLSHCVKFFNSWTHI